ncbi:hypothetical protein LXA43DRAFT_1096258 [Ganoderma leucocontextum]|nr:hypothetical protein LXA43DRAFT_1096258 [Ganoderma leucocontextum]
MAGDRAGSVVLCLCTHCVGRRDEQNDLRQGNPLSHPNDLSVENAILGTPLSEARSEPRRHPVQPHDLEYNTSSDAVTTQAFATVVHQSASFSQDEDIVDALPLLQTFEPSSTLDTYCGDDDSHTNSHPLPRGHQYSLSLLIASLVQRPGLVESAYMPRFWLDAWAAPVLPSGTQGPRTFGRSMYIACLNIPPSPIYHPEDHILGSTDASTLLGYPAEVAIRSFGISEESSTFYI